jgi:hypothetical protein
MLTKEPLQGIFKTGDNTNAVNKYIILFKLASDYGAQRASLKV